MHKCGGGRVYDLRCSQPPGGDQGTLESVLRTCDVTHLKFDIKLMTNIPIGTTANFNNKWVTYVTLNAPKL